MKHVCDKYERELAEFRGLQLICRTVPHTWFDLYFLGFHIGGCATENVAWSRYYERIGATT